jgi:D-3-phosphoglycerate dehydrogenase
MITVHVPLADGTRGLVNESRLKLMRRSGVILNFSRAPIVDDAAIVAALDAGRLHAYICDFPKNALKDHAKVITLPHLGASTGEAEENCAIMVADTVRDFLENGNIRNCVNFPETVLPRTQNTTRFAIANSNVPNMVGQISTCLAAGKLNIAELLNKSRGEYAYTLVDAEGEVSESLLTEIRAIGGVLSARKL